MKLPSITTEQKTNISIDYNRLIQGEVPKIEIYYALFFNHCTKEETPQQNFLIELRKIFEKERDMRIFLDKNNMKSNPVFDMNLALKQSKFIMPVCTPEYVEKYFKKNSWINNEVNSFLRWENQKNEDLIIPILLDLSKETFESQESGIPMLANKRYIIVPQEYLTNDKIVTKIAEEILIIYNDYLKQ